MFLCVCWNLKLSFCTWHCCCKCWRSDRRFPAGSPSQQRLTQTQRASGTGSETLQWPPSGLQEVLSLEDTEEKSQRGQGKLSKSSRAERLNAFPAFALMTGLTINAASGHASASSVPVMFAVCGSIMMVHLPLRSQRHSTEKKSLFGSFHSLTSTVHYSWAITGYYKATLV